MHLTGTLTPAALLTDFYLFIILVGKVVLSIPLKPLQVHNYKAMSADDQIIKTYIYLVLTGGWGGTGGGGGGDICFCFKNKHLRQQCVFLLR